jgi:hypothetical protein
MLLRRRPGDPLEAVEQLVGLQAQTPLDPYFALWSRLEGFDPGELAAHVESGAAVRLLVMRGTLHLVTADDCLTLRAWTQPVLTRAFSGQFGKRLAGADVDAIVEAGRRLVTEEPLTPAALGRRLAERWPDHDPQAMSYAVAYLAPLVQLPPRGVWGKTKAVNLTTAESLLGRELDDEPSAERIIRRYLAAFGPASVNDIQAWSGLTRLREVTNELGDVRRYRSEAGAELLDLPDATVPDPETPAPPRFLPGYDNVVLGYANRERVIDRKQREPVEPAIGRRTFMVDGFVSGFWRIDRDGDDAMLVIEPMGRLSKAQREELSEEGERLLAFAAEDSERRRVRLR